MENKHREIKGLAPAWAACTPSPSSGTGVPRLLLLRHVVWSGGTSPCTFRPVPGTLPQCWGDHGATLPREQVWFDRRHSSHRTSCPSTLGYIHPKFVAGRTATSLGVWTHCGGHVMIRYTHIVPQIQNPTPALLPPQRARGPDGGDAAEAVRGGAPPHEQQLHVRDGQPRAAVRRARHRHRARCRLPGRAQHRCANPETQKPCLRYPSILLAS